MSGPGKLTLLQSRNKNSISERYAISVISELGLKFKKISFKFRGSDERQYCWPNIDFDFISLMQSKYLEYDEYHSSYDNLNFLNKDSFNTSYKIHKKIINNINNSYFPISKTMHEPKMDIYLNYNKNYLFATKVILFLSYCDGKNNLFEISKIINVNLIQSKKILKFCLKNNLIKI